MVPGTPAELRSSEKTGPELFRLSEDPGELKNVIGEHREIATSLDGRLSDFLNSLES